MVGSGDPFCCDVSDGAGSSHSPLSLRSTHIPPFCAQNLCEARLRCLYSSPFKTYLSHLVNFLVLELGTHSSFYSAPNDHRGPT